MTTLAEMKSALEAEKWKPVVGWEGLYDVSSHGRVRALPRTIRQARGRTYVRKAHMMSTKRSTRYVRMQLRDGSRKEHISIHVAVLEAFVGPRPDGHHACHNDGDGRNNRLDNLRWDTPSANNSDKLLHGTAQHGERNPSAKLSTSEAREIRQKYEAGGISQSALAEQYGVHQTHISSIVRGDKWRKALEELK